MEQTNNHWTHKSAEDFQHSIAADFIRFIEDAMSSDGITQAELASRLGVTDGRVSQVLNNPGNLTLRKIVEYARASKRKVAIVGYDDGDEDNNYGPIRADIFSKSWEQLGRPADFFALDEQINAHANIEPKTICIQLFVSCGSLATTDSGNYCFTRTPINVTQHALTRP